MPEKLRRQKRVHTARQTIGGNHNSPRSRTRHVVLKRIEELERRKAWKVHHGEPTSNFDEAIQTVRNIAGTNVHPLTAELFINGAPTRAAIWKDRLSRFEKPPTDRTVGYWVGKFLSMRETEVKSGDLSVSVAKLIDVKSAIPEQLL